MCQLFLNTCIHNYQLIWQIVSVKIYMEDRFSKALQGFKYAFADYKVFKFLF